MENPENVRDAILALVYELRENSESDSVWAGKVAQKLNLSQRSTDDQLRILEAKGFVRLIEFTGNDKSEVGVVYLTPLGVQRVLEGAGAPNREVFMPTSETARYLRRVLEVVDHLQGKDRHIFVGDEQIAHEIGIDVSEVHDYLDLLEQENKVKLAKTFDGYSAMLTSKGRITLRDPQYVPPSSTGNVVHLSGGNYQGAILNIQSTLHDVNQTIGKSPNIDQTAKDELMTLIDQLNSALKQVPQGNEEGAEAVAETAKTLVEAAAKDKPNKTMLKINAQGLKQAAENIAGVLPPVLTIANQIVSLIQTLNT